MKYIHWEYIHCLKSFKFIIFIYLKRLLASTFEISKELKHVLLTPITKNIYSPSSKRGWEYGNKLANAKIRAEKAGQFLSEKDLVQNLNLSVEAHHAIDRPISIV